MVVICDISAWQYWGTPPLLAAVPIAPEVAVLPEPAGAAWPRRLLRSQSNARDAYRLVQDRLLFDLKGLEPPVCVMCDDSANRCHSSLVVPRPIPGWLRPEHVVAIGGGLHVLLPQALLYSVKGHVGSSFSKTVLLAKMMFELAGIFALPPNTSRMRLAMRLLEAEGSFFPDAFRGVGVYGYADARGVPLGDCDDRGDPRLWVPAFDRLGQYAGMWKRPPLTSVEEIGRALDALGVSSPRSCLVRALGMALDGAASPAEVQACILLCANRRLGGEGWDAPCLNRQIIYTSEAVALARSPWCFADGLWPGTGGILEVQGVAFHADRQGFREASGRIAALEAMGYSVAELLPEQMANLELFDAILPTLARKLGFELKERTAAFLRRRAVLHKELFGAPYGPVR